MAGIKVKRTVSTPGKSPMNAGTMRGSGGKGLLGYLANNFPDLYAKFAAAPRDPNIAADYKDEHFAKKRPGQSGRYP